MLVFGCSWKCVKRVGIGLMMQPNYLFLLFCCVIERKGVPLSLIVKSIIFAMQPLAERLRPQTLDDYIGQKHLVGEGAVIRRMIEQKRISSFILWGPPGVGKTTLANIIAKTLDVPFFTLSAVTSGVKDVREVIEKAKASSFFGNVRGGGRPFCSLMRFIASRSRNRTVFWGLWSRGQ